MHAVSWFIAVIACCATSVVWAQADAPLPRSLSGRWTTVVPGVATFTDTMSLTLDAPVQPGPVTGRMTSRGVGCGSQDEPLVGTWDGTVLRFESKVHPNVNTQRMNGQCGTGGTTVVLTRKLGQSTFEGESRRDGMAAPAQVTLAP
jgi:hypothetical protein